jgi:hypothetical protein
MVSKTLFNHFIFYAICPGNQPDQLVKNVQDFLASTTARLFTCKSLQKCWQQKWHYRMKQSDVLATTFVKP